MLRELYLFAKCAAFDTHNTDLVSRWPLAYIISRQLQEAIDLNGELFSHPRIKTLLYILARRWPSCSHQALLFPNRAKHVHHVYFEPPHT